MNFQFWYHADKLLKMSQIVVEKEKGSLLSEVPRIEYPLDYGYLDDGKGEGRGSECWIGSTGKRDVVGAILLPGVVSGEVKLLIGCTQADAELAHEFHTKQEPGALLEWR